MRWLCLLKACPDDVGRFLRVLEGFLETQEVSAQPGFRLLAAGERDVPWLVRLQEAVIERVKVPAVVVRQGQALGQLVVQGILVLYVREVNRVAFLAVCAAWGSRVVRTVP